MKHVIKCLAHLVRLVTNSWKYIGFRVRYEMGSNNVKMPEEASPKKLKPCCACPETKKVRDACIIENGEENCKSYIEAHKQCMRKMGFNI